MPRRKPITLEELAAEDVQAKKSREEARRQKYMVDGFRWQIGNTIDQSTHESSEGSGGGVRFYDERTRQRYS